jgi:hypothetical protein
MTYKLPEKIKAFTYTREELFDCVTRIIAHPHKAITEHDKSRAMAIFLVFADYLDNYTESDNNGGYYVYERANTDFEAFVMETLNLSYHDDGPITPDEILK